MNAYQTLFLLTLTLTLTTVIPTASSLRSKRNAPEDWRVIGPWSLNEPLERDYFLCRLNLERAKVGVKPVRLSTILNNAAEQCANPLNKEPLEAILSSFFIPRPLLEVKAVYVNNPTDAVKKLLAAQNGPALLGQEVSEVGVGHNDYEQNDYVAAIANPGSRLTLSDQIPLPDCEELFRKGGRK